MFSAPSFGKNVSDHIRCFDIMDILKFINQKPSDIIDVVYLFWYTDGLLLININRNY